MLNKILVFLFLAASWNMSAADDAPLVNLSLNNKDVKTFQNTTLQLNLKAQLMANSNWRKLIQQKRMSVSLVDLNDAENIKYASINGSNMMYAASLPKIAVLYAAMDAIEKGELKDTPKVRDDMWLMISKSNNAASTRMIDRVGFQKIEDVMCDPSNPFYDKDGVGGLWVGKRYAAQGKRNPEPIRGLSHAATTDAVAKFYYQLATGQLINKTRSKEMLDIMENPSLHHKFVNTLDRIAPDARLFRKSGSWKNWHSDSILVWGEDGRKYILVALIEDPNGEQIIRNLVQPAEMALRKSVILPIELEQENEVVVRQDT
ncbi:beta-lactamase class A [Nonlabens sp. Hel1_33_55]|uniref:serine hydrolase n=1 Tax=Nonlabens sp. Hel1_33_55 TaxID=1336802 RepID=UPI000875DD76|nr:serine hydrolase [Nonlabens sp. Hel1_33_55]SCY40188.1 beta-lactamase class A [Nonlabens sp. Hel1_33_55]